MKQLTCWYKNPLFFFHILTHLSIIPMILYASVNEWIATIVMYHMFGCIGVAITFHRLVSHRSFDTYKWFKIIGLIFGSLGGVGSSIQWTAVHRDHHRHSDNDKDPHNPAGGFQRFIQIQFLSMLVPSSSKYVPDLLRDPLHQKFHKYYWHLHLVYALAIGFIDPFAIIYAYLFPALLLWHVMSALGTFAHSPSYFGYRTVHTKDKSTNILFLGWLAFGEGWHNNHHANASDWEFGKKFWEFDLSKNIIKIIKNK